MKISAFCCGLFLLSRMASAQPLASRLDSVMRRHFPDEQPGAALLVVIDGRIIYSQGRGRANRETRARITDRTNFRMASVSKQFTAMAILLLEKSGKLSVDDPLLKFFPDFNPRVGQTVTLRHLLTHTSGLKDYESLLPADQKEQVFDADVLRLLKTQETTDFKPGTRFRYSNSGFCLLEQVVEKVAGQPYLSYLTTHIFRPLGMTQTTLYEPGRMIPERAMGYARDQTGAIRFSDQSVTSGTKGDGCVYTSLHDYRKWNDALNHNQLVDLDAWLKRVSQPLPGSKEAFYGLGWFFTHPNGQPLELFHSGSTCGFSNCVVRIPEKQTLIVLFSNLADNHRPFADILRVLQPTVPLSSDIWTLHNLTN